MGERMYKMKTEQQIKNMLRKIKRKHVFNYVSEALEWVLDKELKK